MMKVVRVSNELAKAEKYFLESNYHDTVLKAQKYFNKSQLTEVISLLESLPTEGDLLKRLMKKLKNKSVYRTLKKIEEGKIQNGPQFLKGLGSLLAHVAIEVEQGHKEYSILYPVIYEKLGEILYNN